jgi:hypothetical protein
VVTWNSVILMTETAIEGYVADLVGDRAEDGVFGEAFAALEEA